MGMKKIGVCFGGYCPLHQGHLDVIYQAKKECDSVYVFVCGYESEQRGLDLRKDLAQRLGLIREFFMGDEIIKVDHVNDTELGIDESMSPGNWKIWTEHVKGKILETGDIHYYVGEVGYVEPLKRLGYPVSLIGWNEADQRHENPVSATLIRENPIKYWNKIAQPFRPGLTKKILILGTASEGKSTLVSDLTRYFGIPGTTEFGRDYMRDRGGMKDPELRVEDFIEFLIGQRDYIRKALWSKGNPGVIVSDTDNLVTLMYAKVYSEKPEMRLSGYDYEQVLVPLARSLQTPDLMWDKIFLIPPSGKFVDDGTRWMEQSSLEERQRNYKVLVGLLKEFGLWDNRIEVLHGTYQDYWKRTKEYIYNLLY